MPSRRKRKRYLRRIARTEATAQNPISDASAGENSGGLGGKFQPVTRGDWRLVQRAANQDWPAPPASKQAVCDAIGPTLDTSSTRLLFAVTNAMLAMDAAN